MLKFSSKTHHQKMFALYQPPGRFWRKPSRSLDDWTMGIYESTLFTGALFPPIFNSLVFQDVCPSTVRRVMFGTQRAKELIPLTGPILKSLKVWEQLCLSSHVHLFGVRSILLRDSQTFFGENGSWSTKRKEAIKAAQNNRKYLCWDAPS